MAPGRTPTVLAVPTQPLVAPPRSWPRLHGLGRTPAAPGRAPTILAAPHGLGRAPTARGRALTVLATPPRPHYP